MKPKPFDYWVEPEPNTGCWLWVGARHERGYGHLKFKGKMQKAHRVSYFLEYGVWPPELDHKCRVTSCVNPKHLESVTHQENSLRGIGPTAANAQKTTCPNGHPYDKINWDGGRGCTQCTQNYKREWKRRRRGLHLSAH